MTDMFAEATTSSEAPELSVPYSRIPAIEATALWPGVIPNRTPVLLVAPGGTGKGLSIVAIAAMVTTGERFPGQLQPNEPGQVITIAPEDDPNEDMAFRLQAAGADLSLVRDLTILPSGSPFLLPENEQELRLAIAEANETGPPVKLVTIDPLYAVSTGALSSPKFARSLMTMLQDVTRDYGGAMILSHHTTKDKQEVAGSKQLTDAARLVWLIRKAPDNPDARQWTVFKSNRPVANGPRFLITGEGTGTRAVFTGPESVVQGSRAAKLRLSEARAQQWLDEHPAEPAATEPAPGPAPEEGKAAA